MTNISHYAEKILAEEDRPLFQEAVISARYGAPRGSYILIWIACAEGLKRKFREAVIRDGNANKAIKKIEQAESNHSSADMVILDEAKNYGFIDDLVYQKLKNVYHMRCVYGHPYGTAPSDEELISAAAIVVSEVLGKPTLLKHGFVQSLIGKLLSDVNYIEHSEASVRSFAREISARIAPVVHSYLLETYVEKLDPLHDDASLEVLVKRGLWLLNEFLLIVGCHFYSVEQWHNFVAQYPVTMQDIILESGNLFDAVGERARNYIISYSIMHSNRRPSYLKQIEQLLDGGFLSEEQKNKLQNLDIVILKAANMKISTSYDTLIATLKSRNWHKQNPAVRFIATKSRSEIALLLPSQQEELGRNILQAAEGGANAATSYVLALHKDSSGLMPPFLKGIIFEAFVNEKLEFRFKEECMNVVLDILTSQKDIELELARAIDISKPKSSIFKKSYEDVVGMVKARSNLHLLAEALERNKEKLATTKDDDTDMDFEVDTISPF